LTTKPKIAICWLGGCGGCDEAVIDINETLLTVAEKVDIVLWPIALDFKYSHIKAMADGGIDLSIINGNVRNSEQEEIAKLLRQKSKLVIGFGACACFGGSSGMANFRPKKDIFDWVYRDAPTVVNPHGTIPQTMTKIDGRELTLPEMSDLVRALNQVIEVDYYLPGCPPHPELTAAAFAALLENKLPLKGSSLAPHKSLCDSCSRNETKPAKMRLTGIKRIHEVEASPDTCFLAQGILCLGIATRDGCTASCIKINMPCRGCFGPVEGVKDTGLKMISTLAAILDVTSDAEIEKITDQIGDIAGYLFRFSLPTSKLSSLKQVESKQGEKVGK
jgi:F420-non-reducing hydrogenase small subunit